MGFPIKSFGIFLIGSALILGMMTHISGYGQGPLHGQAQQNARQTHAPESVMIILDSSYSMAEPLNKQESKMVAAKRVILEALDRIPAGTPVGLRIYGHRSDYTSACRATETLVPIGTHNRLQIASQMVKIRPTGATPISLAIEKAIENDFHNIPGPKSIILVSDGIETCSTDPCDLAVKLVRSGVDVKINVVGYGLQGMDATRQLRCVALATKGKFVSANTSAELSQGLNQLLSAKTNVQAQIIPVQQPAPPAQRYPVLELVAPRLQVNPPSTTDPSLDLGRDVQ